MVGVDLLFSFSFVFSWVSTFIQVSKCPIMSQTFLILQGTAADLLCPKPIFTGIIMSIWYHMNPNLNSLHHLKIVPGLLFCFVVFFISWATRILIFLWLFEKHCKTPTFKTKIAIRKISLQKSWNCSLRCSLSHPFNCQFISKQHRLRSLPTPSLTYIFFLKSCRQLLHKQEEVSAVALDRAG